MAICQFCFQSMRSGVGCSPDALHVDGEPVERIPFGHEDHYARYGKRPRCSDCGVPVGAFHHPGCDTEQCRCGWQAIICSCRYDEDEAEAHAGWEDIVDALACSVDLYGAHHATDAGSSPVWTLPTLPLSALTLPFLSKHKSVVEALTTGWDEDDLGELVPLIAVAWDALARTVGTDSTGLLKIGRSQIFPIVNRAAASVADADAGGGPPPLVASFAFTLTSIQRLAWLSPLSDPLHSLLEPLRCHFGLAKHPVERGAPGPCQCFYDDLGLPDWEVRLRVHSGHIVKATAPDEARYDLPAAAGADPLAIIERQLAGWATSEQPALQPLGLLGRLERTKRRPCLWVYGPVEVPGPYATLCLTAEGQPWRALPDRRYRVGHRWEKTDVFSAAFKLRHY